METPDEQTIARERARKRIAAIWERGLPEMRQRLAMLEETAGALAAGGAKTAAVAEAAEIAHKLAGSLGMVGFAEGTRVARELELELESSQSRAERVAELVRQLRGEILPQQ